MANRLDMFGSGHVVTRAHRAAPLAEEIWGAANFGVPDAVLHRLRI